MCSIIEHAEPVVLAHVDVAVAVHVSLLQLADLVRKGRRDQSDRATAAEEVVVHVPPRRPTISRTAQFALGWDCSRKLQKRLGSGELDPRLSGAQQLPEDDKDFSHGRCEDGFLIGSLCFGWFGAESCDGDEAVGKVLRSARQRASCQIEQAPDMRHVAEPEAVLVERCELLEAFPLPLHHTNAVGSLKERKGRLEIHAASPARRRRRAGPSSHEQR